MLPKQEPNMELKAAEKAKAGTKSWVTRAVNACTELAGKDLKQVDVVLYETELQNFQQKA